MTNDKLNLLECARYKLVPKLPKNNKDENFGIKGLLNYRLNLDTKKDGHHHPDCLYLKWDKDHNEWHGRSKLADIFELIYRKKVGYAKEQPDNSNRIVSSDTIFNCWIYLKFYASKILEINLWDCNEKLVYENFNKIFIDKNALDIFDKLANYHHCIANFMPCPAGYNGYSYKDDKGNEHHHDGKGNYKKDWDFPDFYYRRSKRDFPAIYKWIKKNKYKYSLEFFDNYKTLFNPYSYDAINNNDIIGSAKNAIYSIENRAQKLIQTMKD